MVRHHVLILILPEICLVVEARTTSALPVTLGPCQDIAQSHHSAAIVPRPSFHDHRVRTPQNISLLVIQSRALCPWPEESSIKYVHQIRGHTNHIEMKLVHNCVVSINSSMTLQMARPRSKLQCLHLRRALLEPLSYHDVRCFVTFIPMADDASASAAVSIQASIPLMPTRPAC